MFLKLIITLSFFLISFNGHSQPNFDSSDISKLIAGSQMNGVGAKDQEKVLFGAGYNAGTLIIDKQNDAEFRILYSNKPGEGFKQFLTLNTIITISQFSDQSMNIKGLKHFSVISPQNQLFPANLWFAIQSAGTIHLFIRGPVNGSTEPFLLDLPVEHGELKKMSASSIRINGSYQVLVSYEMSNHHARTYLIDYVNGTGSIVADEFSELTTLVNGKENKIFSYDERTHQLTLAKHHAIDLGKVLEKKYSLVRHEGLLSSTSQQVFSGTKNPFLAQETRRPDANGDSLVNGNDNNQPYQDINLKATPTSFEDKIEHNGKVYKIKTVEKGPIDERGIFITRENDNVSVKISTLTHLPSVGGAHGGFKIEDGILTHPNLLRDIDLGEEDEKIDAFKIESTFIPTAEDKESVEWMLKSFPDFKVETKRWLQPNSERQKLSANIIEQLESGDPTAQILVGDTTDKELILADVAKKAPRTWKTLAFDSNRIGDLSRSGQKQEKAGFIKSAITSIPMVLFSRNFTTFGGLGVAEGSPTDLLEELQNVFTSPDGHLKLVGTATSTDDIYNRISSSTVVTSLQPISLSDLSELELKNHLRHFISKFYPKITIDDHTLEFLIEKGRAIKKIDPEPRRSEEFLKSIARKIKQGPINQDEIEKAVTYHFGINPSLIIPEAKVKLIQNFPVNMQKHIAGHEHLINFLARGIQKGLFGMKSKRGAMRIAWIEGPPGVGKTELAKATSKSLNVNFGYIDMNQFKRNSGKSPSDLLTRISTELNKDPFSVLLFDEVEKADPKVLEGLLMATSSEHFEYIQESAGGKKETKKNSLNNSTVIFTSNGIGQIVLDWYYAKIETDPKYENITSEELNKEFSEYMSENDIIKMLTTDGALSNLQESIPPALLDRIKVMVAFPPNFDAMVGLFKIKLKEVKIRALSENGLEIKLASPGKGEDQIIKDLIAYYRKNKISVRKSIEHFEESIDFTVSEIGVNELSTMKKTRYYDIDPSSESYKAVKNQCQIFYRFRGVK